MLKLLLSKHPSQKFSKAYDAQKQLPLTGLVCPKEYLDEFPIVS